MKSSLFVTAAFLLLGASPSHATLGQGEDSIETVRRSARIAQNARKPSTRGGSGAASYTVHEMVSRGATIREYVNASGKVFAVTWHGYRSPKLQTLIGGYEPELRRLDRDYERELRARANTQRKSPAGTSPLRYLGVPRASARFVRSDKLVAIRSGHMRALRGRYFDPNLLPPGVNLDAIQ